MKKEFIPLAPFSASGFLLGALLAATAAAVKILFLEDMEERRAAPTV